MKYLPKRIINVFNKIIELDNTNEIICFVNIMFKKNIFT